jgi:hypothetical protein
MAAMNRFRNMFRKPNFGGDNLFQTYYGTLLQERNEGGPNAQEARRDFEKIRESVSRLSVY